MPQPAAAEQPHLPQQPFGPEAQALREAAKLGDLGALRAALDALSAAGPSPRSASASGGAGAAAARCDAPDAWGFSALMWAAYGGHIEAVRLLIHHGASLHRRDNDGQSALYHAAWNGEAATVDVLLRRGAEPDAADNEGETPLIAAAVNGHSAVVALLLAAGADPTRGNAAGVPPCRAAEEHGHCATARLLRLAAEQQRGGAAAPKPPRQAPPAGPAADAVPLALRGLGYVKRISQHFDGANMEQHERAPKGAAARVRRELGAARSPPECQKTQDPQEVPPGTTVSPPPPPPMPRTPPSATRGPRTPPGQPPAAPAEPPPPPPRPELAPVPCPEPAAPAPKQPTPKQPSPKQPSPKQPTPKQPSPEQPAVYQYIYDPRGYSITACAGSPTGPRTPPLPPPSDEGSPRVADREEELQPRRCSPLQLDLTDQGQGAVVPDDTSSSQEERAGGSSEPLQLLESAGEELACVDCIGEQSPASDTAPTAASPPMSPPRIAASAARDGEAEPVTPPEGSPPSPTQTRERADDDQRLPGEWGGSASSESSGDLDAENVCIVDVREPEKRPEEARARPPPPPPPQQPPAQPVPRRDLAGEGALQQLLNLSEQRRLYRERCGPLPPPPPPPPPPTVYSEIPPPHAAWQYRRTPAAPVEVGVKQVPPPPPQAAIKRPTAIRKQREQEEQQQQLEIAAQGDDKFPINIWHRRSFTRLTVVVCSPASASALGGGAPAPSIPAPMPPPQLPAVQTRLSQPAGEPAVRGCTLCEDPATAESDLWECRQCEEVLCTDCWRTEHQNKKRRDHTPRAAPRLQPRPDPEREQYQRMAQAAQTLNHTLCEVEKQRDAALANVREQQNTRRALQSDLDAERLRRATLEAEMMRRQERDRRTQELLLRERQLHRQREAEREREMYELTARAAAERSAGAQREQDLQQQLLASANDLHEQRRLQQLREAEYKLQLQTAAARSSRATQAVDALRQDVMKLRQDADRAKEDALRYRQRTEAERMRAVRLEDENRRLLRQIQRLLPFEAAERMRQQQRQGAPPGAQAPPPPQQQQQPQREASTRYNREDMRKALAEVAKQGLAACDDTAVDYINANLSHVTVHEAWLIVGLAPGTRASRDAAKKLMTQLHPDRVAVPCAKETLRKRFQVVNHVRGLLPEDH